MAFPPAIKLERGIPHIVLGAFDAELAAFVVTKTDDARQGLAEAPPGVDVGSEPGIPIHRAVCRRASVGRNGSLELKDGPTKLRK